MSTLLILLSWLLLLWIRSQIYIPFSQIVATLKDVEDCRFDPGPDLDFAVTNVMCTALFSTRYKRDDKEFLMLYQNQRVINDNIWKSSPQGKQFEI